MPPMPTYNMDITGLQTDIPIPAGVDVDIIFRCIGSRNTSVTLVVPFGDSIDLTTNVYRGNAGDVATDTLDVVASAALLPIGPVLSKLYEKSGSTVKFLSFRFKSTNGTTLTVAPNGE